MDLPNDFSIITPRESSDTSSKKWSMMQNGSNTDIYPDYPKQIWDNPDEQDTITIIAKYPIIKAILKSMTVNVNMSNYKKRTIPFEDLVMMNQRTSKLPLLNFVEHNKESKFPTPVGCEQGMQAALDKFLSKFNKLYNEHPSEKRVPDYFGRKKFEITRYQLLGIDDGKRDSIFKTIIVLFRQNAIHSIHLYLEVLTDGGVVDWDIVGYHTTDKLLTFKGKNTISNNFYATRWLYEKGSQVDQPVFTDDDFETYYNNHYYNKSNRLAHTYSCFNAEPQFFKTSRGTEQSIVYPYYNKTDCESDHDVVGQRKVRGFWDRRCLTNEECPFYNANKNYKNNRGGCMQMTGYCELPSGMQNFGYRKYLDPEKYPENKPMCYNCKSTDKWDPLTKIGQCCEEQKDKTKYPFLKSPDYAFSGDVDQRVQFEQQREYYDRFKKFLANI